LACLTILLGTGIAQEKDRSPDEQVKDLILKYRALPEKDQIGPKGASILKQLKAVPGKLTQQSREDIAELVAAHNIRQIALAIQNYEGKGAKPLSVDPKLFSQLLPYIEPELYLGLGRYLQKGYHGPWWTKAEVALLGRVSDEEVARRTGRSVYAVRQKREALRRHRPGGRAEQMERSPIANRATRPPSSAGISLDASASGD
jgi:hypothetical protein